MSESIDSPFSQRTRPLTETLVTSFAAGYSQVKSPLCAKSGSAAYIFTSTPPSSFCVMFARHTLWPLSVSVPVRRTVPSLTVTIAAIARESTGKPI